MWPIIPFKNRVGEVTPQKNVISTEPSGPTGSASTVKREECGSFKFATLTALVLVEEVPAAERWSSSKRLSWSGPFGKTTVKQLLNSR